MRKLDAKWAGFIMPLVLSVIMTSIVSFISTLRAVGFQDALPGQWLQAWGLSWAVAFPVLFAVLPIVRRVVAALVESP